jgi:Fis family transcriptional regulator
VSGENELSRCVRRAVESYIRDLDGEKPSAMYELVISHVEKPLLEAVLRHAEGNQTLAADMLGLNRNTLRKKIKAHRIKF